VAGSELDALVAAFAEAPDCVGMHRDGRIVMANRRMCELFGWGAGELTGRMVVDLVAPGARAQLAERIAARSAGASAGADRPIQVIGLRHDGTSFDLEIHATSVHVEGVVHGLAFVRDVTAETRSEAARRDREEMYRALFEVNAAIKLLIDPSDGSIIDANPAAAAFYGWSLDELRAMRISDINLLTADEIALEMERARSRRRTSFHFRHRLRGGQVADVEVHSGPLEVRGRTLLLSIIHDITERNRFETQLRHAQRLEAIGRLAAGMAHDFNNVLTVIQASAQLAGRFDPSDRIRRCLADIRSASKRGADLTRHLLGVGRDHALRPEPVDLATVLPRTGALLQRVLGDAITVTTDVPELPAAWVDLGQLELVLINLALNARDAMPGGGHIRIGAEQPAPCPERLSGAPCVAVTVTDDGAGMDEETLARVFEPFFTTKHPAAGSGLGLAIAWSVLDQSGGTITIDSRPTSGTRVTLYLPLAAPTRVAVTPAAQATGSRTGSVLLVDDEPMLLHTLGALLRAIGLTVHEATSARGALASLSAMPTPPDLILCDIAMPERSGIELVADLAATWPQVPVVLMSGHAAPGELPPGAVGFLPKPFPVEDLVALLDRLEAAP
jgi:PAS domain S-box-containing protein